MVDNLELISQGTEKNKEEQDNTLKNEIEETKTHQ